MAYNQLKHSIKDVSGHFLVTLNDAGSLYIDKYNDNIKKVKDIGDYKALLGLFLIGKLDLGGKE